MRDAWKYTSDASVLKLDLKSTSEPVLHSLVHFIDARPGERQIILVSTDEDALGYLDSALPDSIEFLTLAGGATSTPSWKRMGVPTESMGCLCLNGR